MQPTTIVVDERGVEDTPTQGVVGPGRPALNTEGLKLGYVFSFTVVHAAALLALVPWFFSWTGVLVMVVAAVACGWGGIVIGYHRLLTHRSFRVPTWLERSLATVAMCALQETPARWVAWHRAHHRHADRFEDPHSPLAGAMWAHMTWLVRGTRAGDARWFSTEEYAHDILRDPYYRWMERLPRSDLVFYFGHAAVIAAVAAAACVWAYGPTTEALRMTLSVVVWGVAVRTVLAWHVTWSVNSLAHLFGYRNFDTPDDSRNNWLVALLTAGEGWHNNHHADPASATVRVRWWEVDPAFMVIWLLARVGLASDLVPPRRVREGRSRPARGKPAAGG